MLLKAKAEVVLTMEQELYFLGMETEAWQLLMTFPRTGSQKKTVRFGQMLFTLSILIHFLFFSKDFICLFEKQREAETQAEGEAGSMLEACHGT